MQRWAYPVKVADIARGCPRPVTEPSLPPPPGVLVATLPRERGDKPQETSVAVNPLDPRNVIVSYHRAIDAGSDHHEGVRVEVHVAASCDGGESWTVTDASHT